MNRELVSSSYSLISIVPSNESHNLMTPTHVDGNKLFSFLVRSLDIIQPGNLAERKKSPL